MTPDITTAGERARAVIAAVEKAVVGKRDALELVLIALLADGHVLIEDVPGLGKTLIARSFAAACGLGFGRIQCTPDLLPSDITGSTIFDQRSAELRFVPGPVFTHVLLADEVNRATPKTQAALLEAMEERQVTTDQGTRALDRPFLVMATQNPIEFEGTYPLPEAQVDRFLLRIAVGYPSADGEWEMLERRLLRGRDEAPVATVLGDHELIELQAAVETVYVSERIGRYAVELVVATRADADVSVGASPRGTLALAKLARARAVLWGRDFVIPEDVQEVAVPALAHRLLLRPESWVRELRGEQVVRRCLDRVAVPPVAEDDE